MNTFDLVIQKALQYIGYIEKKTNSQLEDFTANAGYGNYTMFAEYFDEEFPEFFNTKKNGFPWCAVFVCYCFIKAYGKEAGRKMLYLPYNNLAAGCEFMAQYFKDKGKYTSVPKPGRPIFFWGYNHVGIVEKVEGGIVYTIEGNTAPGNGTVVANGGIVCRKQYPVNAACIWGYGIPDFDEEPEERGVKEVDVSLNEISYGAMGEQVKSLQILLNGKINSSLSVDGIFGTRTKNAVVSFQKQKKLDADGIVGIKTWSALLK